MPISRELIALGAVKTMLDPYQRLTLGAVLFRTPGGRGLTYAAQTEWGRPPAALNESEMTWLFVIGQWPHCSKHRVIPEAERKECEDLYQSLLTRAALLR